MNFYRIKRCYAAFFLLVFLVSIITARATYAGNIYVSVQPGTDNNHLRVILVNRTSRFLTMYRSALPWGNRYSMILLAIPSKVLSAPLEQGFPIDDPSFGTIKIVPGEKLYGDINLRGFFKD
jgi:hypothetical protein